MSTLIAIDPGTRALGFAIFEDRELRRCGLVRAFDLDNMCRTLRTHPITEGIYSNVVVEVPQVYRHTKDASALIKVALVAGACASVLVAGQIETVLPHAWKGTRPKEICNKLTRSILEPEELDILTAVDAPKSLMHNVVDAVGIGLWKVGRR